MSVVPIGSFLVDFGSEAVAAISDEPLHAPAIAADDEDTQAQQIEAAYERGREEARAAAQAELEARLEEQRATLEQSLAASREAWCNEEAGRVAEQLKAALGELEDRIAQSVEHVLRPFLIQAVRDKAMAELRTTVRELVAASPGITLEISGPEDLLEAVRSSLSPSVATVSYVTNEACELAVKAGASVIETRISAWLDQIEGPAE